MLAGAGLDAKIRPVLPRTYCGCRSRLRRIAGASLESRPITARGPHGEALTIDVAIGGDPTARQVLLVLSGVHGVEGFAPSAIQCELLGRSIPPGVRVVVVHAANPWGMAWHRRQNESNVDLNRNWSRDRITPPDRGPGYADLHHLLVPGGDVLPSRESFLDGIAALRERHGISWLRAAISGGQYTHPDGLYFGGEREEASTRLLRSLAETHLSSAELVLTVDLHTGHGKHGTYTLLSHVPAGTGGDAWLRRHFDEQCIEVTVANPDATAAPKVGQLAKGLGELVGAEYHDVTFELGTFQETRMILAERAEHWVHFHGDRNDPAHAAAVWEHRICSTPDDREWERQALAHGRRVLDQALTAVAAG